MMPTRTHCAPCILRPANVQSPQSKHPFSNSLHPFHTYQSTAARTRETISDLQTASHPGLNHRTPPPKVHKKKIRYFLLTSFPVTSFPTLSQVTCQSDPRMLPSFPFARVCLINITHGAPYPPVSVPAPPRVASVIYTSTSSKILQRPL